MGEIFSFESGNLQPVVAHGGRAPILARRALERATDTGCRFVDLVEIPVGADIGGHTHEPDDEELYVVIAGRGCVTVDGATSEVGAGDVIVNRPGGTHSLVNVGEVTLRLVVVDVAAADLT